MKPAGHLPLQNGALPLQKQLPCGLMATVVWSGQQKSRVGSLLECSRDVLAGQAPFATVQAAAERRPIPRITHIPLPLPAENRVPGGHAIAGSMKLRTIAANKRNRTTNLPVN